MDAVIVDMEPSLVGFWMVKFYGRCRGSIGRRHEFLRDGVSGCYEQTSTRMTREMRSHLCFVCHRVVSFGGLLVGTLVANAVSPMFS